MTVVELLILKTEEEYRVEYLRIYTKNNFLLYDIPVVFSEKDFDHIFFELGKDGQGKFFSQRRAKRMHFMKSILSNKLDTEVMFEPSTNNFAVFCVDLECVMYLRPRVGSGILQVATFFDFGKGHTKMYQKQKKKCIPISLQEIKAML